MSKAILSGAGVMMLIATVIAGCEKEPMPAKAVVAFRATRCPTGWQAYVPGQGRYIVGLTKGGTVEKVVGASLANAEDRPAGNHTHAYERVKWILERDGGFGPGTYKGSGQQTYTGPVTALSGQSSPNGTNAPYIQLLYCEKG